MQKKLSLFLMAAMFFLVSYVHIQIKEFKVLFYLVAMGSTRLF